MKTLQEFALNMVKETGLVDAIWRLKAGLIEKSMVFEYYKKEKLGA